MVIIGFAGGDRGTRGRVKAFDAKDGKLVWTFYTIPGPGEPGHDTWPTDNDAWKYGGGSVWQTPAVDPELGLVYFSTGNAAPDYNGAFRAGDNLYTASIVAIDAATGKYRWHFQASPSRHLGLRRGQSRRADGRAHRTAARARRSPRSARRAGPTSSIARPASRSSASTSGPCRRSRAGDRRDAAVPARRGRRAAVRSRSRPKDSRSSTTAASSRLSRPKPDAREPRHLGRRELAAELLRPGRSSRCSSARRRWSPSTTAAATRSSRRRGRAKRISAARRRSRACRGRASSRRST